MSFVSATSQGQPPVWQTYLDLQDVKDWLQFDSSSTAFDSKVQAVADMACVWVQNYLNQPVAPTQFFRRFNGWSGWQGCHVMLPYRPVLQVISVVEWWGGSGPHNLVEQTPEFQGSSDMYQVVPLSGRITRTFRGLIQRPFFPGSGNIEVTWVAGYNPTPQDIKMATLELTNYWWRNTQEAPRTSPLALNEYDQLGTTAAGGLWPAIPNRVTALLQPYRIFTVA